MNVLMLTVPFWDYYTPFLALPCLKGHLTAKGYDVKVIDLNIKYFQYVIYENVINSIQELFDEDKFRTLDNNYFRAFESKNSREFKKNVQFFKEKYRTVQGFKEDYKKLSCKQLNFLDSIYHYTFFKGIYGPENDRDILELNVQKLETRFNGDSLKWVLEQSEYSRYVTDETVIAISATSQEQFAVALIYAKDIKRRYPQNYIVLGGSYSNYILRILDDKNKLQLFDYFDFISYAEGETSLEKLMDYLIKEEGRLEEVPGIAYKTENSIIKMTKQCFENLDELYLPDFTDIYFEDYLLPVPMIPYQISRGCFWGNCAFCDHEESYRRNFKSKTVVRVVDDLEKLKEKYNIKHFQFVDEAIEPGYMEHLVEEIQKRSNLKDIQWLFYSRISRFYTNELVRKMHGTGCRLTLFGVETFNPRLLKLIKKGIRVSYIYDNLQLFHNNGIACVIWLIAGFPTQSVQELREDIVSLEQYESVLDGVFAGLFRLEPNCDIYKEKEKYGICDFDENDKYTFISKKDGIIIDQKEIKRIFREEFEPVVDKISISHNRYIIYMSNLDDDCF